MHLPAVDACMCVSGCWKCVHLFAITGPPGALWGQLAALSRKNLEDWALFGPHRMSCWAEQKRREWVNVNAGRSQRVFCSQKLKIACRSRTFEPYGKELKDILWQNALSPVWVWSTTDPTGHFQLMKHNKVNVLKMKIFQDARVIVAWGREVTTLWGV